MAKAYENEMHIICPYCEYKDINSNEDFKPKQDKVDDEWECGSCGEIFTVVSEIEVSYSSYPRKEK